MFTHSVSLNVFSPPTIILYASADTPDSGILSPFSVCSSPNWVFTALKLGAALVIELLENLTSVHLMSTPWNK